MRKFGFDCCCYCDACCEDGLAADEIEVEIDFSDNGCARCDDTLSGTFVLSRVTPDVCRWVYGDYFFSASETNCEKNTPDIYDVPRLILKSLIINLEISCKDAANYFIKLDVVQTFRRHYTVFSDYPENCAALLAPNAATMVIVNSYGYTKTISRASFDCETFSGVVVDRDSSFQSCTCGGDFAGGSGSPTGICNDPLWLCENGATVNATISAVP